MPDLETLFALLGGSSGRAGRAEQRTAARPAANRDCLESAMGASWEGRTLPKRPGIVCERRSGVPVERQTRSVRDPRHMLDSGNATEASPPARPWTGPVARAIHAEPGELKAVLLAFFYFFFLLSGYYILRPLRDEMGVAGGGGRRGGGVWGAVRGGAFGGG